MNNLKPAFLPDLQAKLKPLSGRIERYQEDLSRFFANSIGMLCIAGFDGYFKRLNPAWKNTLGWTLKELQARPFLEFVHPDDHAATLVEMKKLARGGCTILFENRYRCKDGLYRWLQWNANSLPANQQIHAIARDVTLRKRLENELLDASDREKERLGRELHDGLCQDLAGIAALSATLSRNLAADSGPVAALAAEIGELLNETIGHARDMARGLNPVGLEQIGLAAALEVFSANVCALFRIFCGFKCNRSFPNLGSGVETHLFRIAQEAVNNAMSHGRARRIDISLSLRSGKGFLRVRDDGVGISMKPLAGNGAGLHTMDFRARIIGGSLQVRRLAGGGTVVTCAFPLPPAPRKEPSHGRKKN